MGLFDKFKSALKKSRDALLGGLGSILSGRKLDEDLLEEIEEALIESDVGVRTTESLLDELRDAWKAKEVTEGDQVIGFFKARLASRLGEDSRELLRAESGPTVILVCGVNGSGKTTSIAKLTGWFHDRGEKVVLAAGDTFRAAAVEQLTIWSKRIGVEIVKQATGADPAAVAYDAAEAALSRQADVLIVDTAGRLHTQKNLMEELGKIRRVLGKCIPGAPHETLLVLDGTTGQNAIQQARLFHEVSPVTGIFLTKLDGTARGGAVLSIHDELGLPVKFVGLGEKREDIEPFDATTFVDALFA
ncbi:MAG: signal recognition particle-docking protein FtsY [Planctomycetota bacterium]|jgi:fused signal recognition particle receptor